MGRGVAALGAASKDASPFTIAVIRSAVLAPLFSLFSNFSEAKKGGIIYAALSGVVGLALGSTAFIYAMSQIGVAATVIATSLTPILSQLLDRAVNKATIYPKHILGATLVGLGTAISMTNN
ncbi:DMT family transporter [Pyrobaculum aerophilum]|uniref:DMT family transporter n=1 Tax=Pyrobaculum aerophilum TaxID=13773 RepID=UPI0021616FB3|nr:DMT family transporter [Pyrobaculum aerophilum]